MQIKLKRLVTCDRNGATHLVSRVVEHFQHQYGAYLFFNNFRASKRRERAKFLSKLQKTIFYDQSWCWNQVSYCSYWSAFRVFQVIRYNLQSLGLISSISKLVKIVLLYYSNELPSHVWIQINWLYDMSHEYEKSDRWVLLWEQIYVLVICKKLKVIEG